MTDKTTVNEICKEIETDEIYMQILELSTQVLREMKPTWEDEEHPISKAGNKVGTRLSEWMSGEIENGKKKNTEMTEEDYVDEIFSIVWNIRKDVLAEDEIAKLVNNYEIVDRIEADNQ